MILKLNKKTKKTNLLKNQTLKKMQKTTNQKIKNKIKQILLKMRKMKIITI